MLRPLGEERQSHWAFLYKAYDIGQGSRSMFLNHHRSFRRCLMNALVVVDTIFNEILKVKIKMTMSMELEI